MVVLRHKIIGHFGVVGISTLIRVRHGYRANHRVVGHCGRSDVWLCVTEE